MLNLLFLGDSDRGHLGPRWQDGPLRGSLYGREAWVVAPVAQMAQGCPGAGLESLGCSRGYEACALRFFLPPHECWDPQVGASVKLSHCHLSSKLPSVFLAVLFGVTVE